MTPPQLVEEQREQRPPAIRLGGRRKARPVTAVGVGGQRELGNHQQAAAVLTQAHVHPASVIRENTVGQQAFGHTACLGRAVFAADGDEGQQTRPDFANDLAVDTHTGPRDPLDQDVHEARAWLETAPGAGRMARIGTECTASPAIDADPISMPNAVACTVMPDSLPEPQRPTQPAPEVLSGLPARAAWVLVWLIGRLPLRGLQALGRMLGAMLPWLWPRGVAIARRNLELAFPDQPLAEREALLAASLAENGATFAELPLLWTRSTATLLALVREVRGFEHLLAARDKGQGVLVLAPHLGAWELLNPWFAQHMPVTVLYRPPRQRWLEPLLRRGRAREGTRQVRAEGNAIRGLFRALKAGQLVGVLPDQEPKQGEGQFAPFFATEALTMVLPGRLVERCGCEVLFSFAERLPRGQGYRVHILPPPLAMQGRDPAADARAVNAGIEALVNIAPAQYQWLYKRYNIRPDPAARGSLYRSQAR